MSNAWKTSSKIDPSLSVDLARLTSPEASAGRAGRPGFGVGASSASIPLRMGLAVVRDPLPGNDVHALIVGCSTKAEYRELARNTVIVLRPVATDQTGK